MRKFAATGAVAAIFEVFGEFGKFSATSGVVAVFEVFVFFLFKFAVKARSQFRGFLEVRQVCGHQRGRGCIQGVFREFGKLAASGGVMAIFEVIREFWIVGAFGALVPLGPGPGLLGLWSI